LVEKVKFNNKVISI